MIQRSEDIQKIGKKVEIVKRTVKESEYVVDQDFGHRVLNSKTMSS